MSKINDIPVSARPREKLIEFGVSSLSDCELLSIILKSGTKNKSVIELAEDILKELNGIGKIKDCDINWLMNIKGVGKAKACEVIATIELGKRLYLKKEISLNKIKNSKDVYENMKYLLVDKKQEYFYCIYLNNKNCIIERKLLFMGTINKSIVHPREIFKHAYLSSASSIICVHNHPSGDIIPSKEDINLTKALLEISRIQAIPILDHIIIGNDGYYSMQENLELFL